MRQGIGTQLEMYDFARLPLAAFEMPDRPRRESRPQALALPACRRIVNATIERLGVEQANASQHLSILRAKRILVNRKVGNQVFYSVRDPRILQVLDIMKQYFYDHLNEDQALLEEIKSGKNA